MRRFRVAHNAAFLDHWASEPLSEIRWNRWISGNESFLPTASFVAQADGEVVGYSVNFAYPEEWEGIGHSEGWIGGLGTTRDWRKKGVASALIEASLEAFRALGYDRAALGVDSENPTGALGLYTRLGFVPARREAQLFDPGHPTGELVTVRPVKMVCIRRGRSVPFAASAR